MYLLEARDVVPVEISGFVVERVVGIGLVKQVNQAVNHLDETKFTTVHEYVSGHECTADEEKIRNER